MAVDGWMNLSRQIGAHKPHTDTGGNSTRKPGTASDRQGGSGCRTAGPGLRGPDCDEVTRTHEIRGEQGLPSLQMCGACHPALRF